MIRDSEPQKIFVELDDEITFVVERVRSSMSSKVILIIPSGAALISSIVSLKILSKELIKTDKIAILVTKDSLGLSLGSRAGLVSVDEVHNINEALWITAEKNHQNFLLDYLKRKKDLIEKRKIQNSENLEEAADRVDEVIEQQENENVNQVTADVQKEIVKTAENEKIEEEKARKLKNLKAMPKIIEDNGIIISSGGDITQDPNFISKIVSDDLDCLNYYEENQQKNDNLLENLEVEDKIPKSSNLYKNELDKLNNHKSLLNQNFSKFNEPIVVSNKKKKYKFEFQQLKNIFISIENKKIIFTLSVIFLILAIIIIVSQTSIIIVLQKIQKEVDTTQNISASLTQTDNNVPVKTLTIELNQSMSVDTTGEKDIGEKASGQVTIFNKNTTSAQVPAKTLLKVVVGGEELHYFTVVNVTIGPKVTEISGVSYGVANVNVVAENAGTKYNIAAQGKVNTFSIGDNPKTSLEGTNLTTFSGGTSKKVKIAAKSDIDKASKSLSESIKAKSLEELKNKYGSDFIFIQNAPTFSMTSITSSLQAGQEGTSVDITVVGSATIQAITNSDIDTYAKSFFSSQNSNTEIVKLEYTPTIVSVDKNVVNLSLQIKASYFDKIDLDQIKKDLAGKNFDEIQKYFENNISVKLVNANFSPSFLPQFMKNIPNDVSKIKIDVKQN